MFCLSGKNRRGGLGCFKKYRLASIYLFSTFYNLHGYCIDALREAQRSFAGEAERLGLKDDDDVMEMIKSLRQESVVK